MRKVVSLKSAFALAILVGLLAFLAGSYSTPTPATAQAPIRWKMQTAWPLGIFPDDAAKLLVSTIEKTSGGRRKIEVSPAGSVVPAFEIQDAVSRGVERVIELELTAEEKTAFQKSVDAVKQLVATMAKLV